METNAEAINSSAPLSETNTDASGKMHCGINSNSEVSAIGTESYVVFITLIAMYLHGIVE